MRLRAQIRWHARNADETRLSTMPSREECAAPACAAKIARRHFRVADAARGGAFALQKKFAPDAPK
jgi:hypothetical protein